MNPVLALTDLRISRGKTVILHDLSWRVERGEHWVILGANGSGKTSLLGALTAYLTPSSGTVELLGATYGRGADWRELRRRVGMVSSSLRQMLPDDEAALLTVLSGKDAQIQFWGRRPSPAQRAEALACLEQVECVHLAERPWAVLSQGERQRVLIARGLMARPALLILDEPCAGMDPVARERFLTFVERLGQRTDPGAPTLVLVTHHVEEILPVFTHALLIREGRALAAGPTRTVLTSANLSATFGATLRLRRTRDGRWSLTMDHATSTAPEGRHPSSRG